VDRQPADFKQVLERSERKTFLRLDGEARTWKLDEIRTALRDLGLDWEPPGN
jgi:hypothetical protein